MVKFEGFYANPVRSCARDGLFAQLCDLSKAVERIFVSEFWHPWQGYVNESRLVCPGWFMKFWPGVWA